MNALLFKLMGSQCSEEVVGQLIGTSSTTLVSHNIFGKDWFSERIKPWLMGGSCARRHLDINPSKSSLQTYPMTHVGTRSTQT